MKRWSALCINGGLSEPGSKAAEVVEAARRRLSLFGGGRYAPVLSEASRLRGKSWRAFARRTAALPVLPRSTPARL